MGVLAYELLEGHCPFERDTRRGTYDAIMAAAPNFPLWMSNDAIDFIRSALCKVIEDNGSREGRQGRITGVKIYQGLGFPGFEHAVTLQTP